ncbi:MAG TPA: VOC family protein [Frankiaceae bacterium]|jgi:catechol 2,3-dioxygenase-like lactoylglutathione lyase family enzyme|nr:VOC family protein [Frankiaceae bacterium]
MTTAAKPDLPPLTTGLGAVISPSHLIHNVADTDATIRFYRDIFGAGVERDMEIESPALDAMFGRAGVRIRSTFIDAGGYRLHTIERLDEPRTSKAASMGLTGLSFGVPDLEAARQTAIDAGYQPTPIFDVDLGDPRYNAKMFFIADPDGVGCELVEYPK